MEDELEDFFDEIEEDVVEDASEDFLEEEEIGEDIIDEDDFFNEDPAEEEGAKKASGILGSLLEAVNLGEGVITEREGDEDVQVNIADLPVEDQMQIIKSELEVSVLNDLGEDAKFLQELKDKGESFESFLQGYKEIVTAEALKEVTPAEADFEIDTYGDQELFLLDQKAKYNLTDEELASELEKELQNEELFQRKVGVLREEYKQLEQLEKDAKQQQFKDDQQQQYNEFSDNIRNAAQSVDAMGVVELEEADKAAVMQDLLDLDETGTNAFTKQLQNDPQSLFKAAWFLRYGEEAFEAMQQAYEGEITRISKPDHKQAPRVTRKAAARKKGKSIFDL